MRAEDRSGHVEVEVRVHRPPIEHVRPAIDGQDTGFDAEARMLGLLLAVHQVEGLAIVLHPGLGEQPGEAVAAAIETVASGAGDEGVGRRSETMLIENLLIGAQMLA